MEQLLTIDDLAKILRLSRQTLKADVTRRPETLPPRLRVPGCRRVLWRPQDVEAWLAKQVER